MVTTGVWWGIFAGKVAKSGILRFLVHFQQKKDLQ